MVGSGEVNSVENDHPYSAPILVTVGRVRQALRCYHWIILIYPKEKALTSRQWKGTALIQTGKIIRTVIRFNSMKIISTLLI